MYQNNRGTQVNDVQAWVMVRDDQSRDLPVLFNKCPALDRNLLDVKVMDTSPWLPEKKN